jgi:two-component system, cell cycle sensor histidine kinase and response regulator CckA
MLPWAANPAPWGHRVPNLPFSFQTIVEMSNEAIWVVDADRNIAYVNERAAEIAGYRPEEVVGKSVLTFFFPDDVPAMEARLARRESGEAERYQHRLRRRDGSAVWALISARPRVDETGRYDGSVVIVTDITELARTESALRDSEFWLRESQRVARLGSYVFDIPTDRWQSSAVLDEVFGIGPDYPRNAEGWLAIVHPDDRQRMAAYLRELLAARHRFDREYRVTRVVDGAERWVHGLGELTLDGDGRPVRLFGTIQDITEHRLREQERRHLEARLLNAQKLESLGVLAGGIAHEFNNLLTSILGNADLALHDLPPGSTAIESIRAVEAASQRAAEISRQMLAYSGRGRFVVEPVVLSRLVREMGRMIELAVSKRTRLRMALAEDLPRTDADPDQLRQVVMNLVVNAAEAVADDEGLVTVSTGETTCDAAHPLRDHFGEDVAPGRYVVLEVADTGQGIDAESLPRVFDPFFTTKFTGRGLGLPAVAGIVRGHRGFVQVESEPGRGTTFRILLPALPTATPMAAPSAAPNDRGRV